MRKNLTRKERLARKKDVDCVFNNSDYESSCRGAKVKVRRNGLNYNRFTVLLVRKYGNSVKRNYSRRIVKEIYRKKKHSIPSGYDILFILYPGKYSYYDREKQFIDLFKGRSIV